VTLAEEGIERAVFSTSLLLGGLVGLVIAEVWAFPMIALDAHHLGLLDFVISHRFWHFVFQKLPRTRGPVCLLSWCLTAVLGSLLIVGGLFYWLPGKHRTRFQLAAPEGKVKLPDGDTAIEEGTLLRTVVLGYLPDKKEALEGLVLGVPEGKDQFRYIGVVRRGISMANEEQLRQCLAPLRRPDSAVPGLELRAAVIWVEPRVRCEVLESSAGSAETLPNPLFKGLLPDPDDEKKEPG
jgi:hypothetical protein